MYRLSTVKKRQPTYNLYVAHKKSISSNPHLQHSQLRYEGRTISKIIDPYKIWQLNNGTTSTNMWHRASSNHTSYLQPLGNGHLSLLVHSGASDGTSCPSFTQLTSREAQIFLVGILFDLHSHISRLLNDSIKNEGTSPLRTSSCWSASSCLTAHSDPSSCAPLRRGNKL